MTDDSREPLEMVPSADEPADPELQVAEAVRRAASAPPEPGDAERRRRLLRIQGFVDSFADKHAARNAVSALDAQFLLDELDAAQSALTECRQDRDHYRAKAYELGDAEGKLKDELAAAQVEVARLKERWQAACEQIVETAMEAATASAELSRLRATAARKGDREMAEKQVGKIGFDARNSSGDAFMDRANELADVIATARAQGHAAGVREGIDALDERLPHGWMWDLRRYMNHPWAQRGYAKIWAPHIDDPPVEVYARTPGEALQQAIDRALGAPEPQE